MSARTQFDQEALERGREQVAALMSAWLAEPGEQPDPGACLTEGPLDEAVGNAPACIHLLAALLGELVAGLAARVEMTPLEFWRPTAVRLSSQYPEGDTL
ncbi:hypothetical protein M2158_001083 [Streptomyces sp. SAI-144]|uniref:hypothetical protein n=1 Tax=Streptomyces sp. SAI-144 TaxID=2940544 RepID=UPI002477071C|nr:hypothetical protein [Streptomyces sp. SAI-144]MDH6432606.1 hypothetical protein [Streptomyces sp. SAI-144]